MNYVFVLLLLTYNGEGVAPLVDVVDYDLSGSDCIARLIEESDTLEDSQWHACELQEVLPIDSE